MDDAALAAAPVGEKAALRRRDGPVQRREHRFVVPGGARASRDVGGLLVGAEVQGAGSALATRTCPGRRSEPWWEGDKASGMLRCLITGASAGSRAWSSAAPVGQASPPPSHTPHDHREGGATWVLARADGSSAVASLGAPRATF